jgi:3-deoxy-D-manno-octulosonic-acid transferase
MSFRLLSVYGITAKPLQVNLHFHRRLYDRLILPLIWGGSRVSALFVPKVREGLAGRQDLLLRVRAFRAQVGRRKILLFHCASAGELEALKPLAQEFDRERIALALSYFSPSARQALRASTEFDFADYSPIDAHELVAEYMDALRPDVIAITKHDIWPNFVWTAHDRNIPLFLINGNFHAQSLRLWPAVRQFHAAIYRSFTELMTVSEDDAQRARRIVGTDVPVRVVGDSRYDRVLMRMAERRPLPDHIEQIAADRTVLVCGSTHEEDENLLVPVLAEWSAQNQRLLTIFVPHDPSPKARRRLLDLCRMYKLSLWDCDGTEPYGNESAILLNRSGILADLYRVGGMAFVGGGFGKGVHSVLEPMTCGLPVLCGPKIVVSHEARAAEVEGILQTVHHRHSCAATLREWLGDEATLTKLHERTKDFVRKRAGAVHHIAARLREALGE